MEAPPLGGLSKEFVGTLASEPLCADQLQGLEELDLQIPGGLVDYLARGRRLLAKNQEGHAAFLEGVEKIGIPQTVALDWETADDIETYLEAEKVGIDELASCVFVLVAGGLGERLGSSMPKILMGVDPITRVSFFEYYCQTLVEYQRTTESPLFLVIMTSGHTQVPILKMLEDHQYFGLDADHVFLLQQMEVPTFEDPLHLATHEGYLILKPHGHGDVHSLLHQSGLLNQFLAAGKKWVYIFQDSNALTFRSFLPFLGVSAHKNWPMNMMGVFRHPEEKMGALVKITGGSLDGSTLNIEYNELGLFLAKQPELENQLVGNLNLLLFRLDAYKSGLEASQGQVPEFVNPKKRWDGSFRSPVRLESCMQDFAQIMHREGQHVGVTVFRRALCFAVMKNSPAEGLAAQNLGHPPDTCFSGDAQLFQANAEYLRKAGGQICQTLIPHEAAGVRALLGPLIILKPNFALGLAQLSQKIGDLQVLSPRVILILGGAQPIPKLWILEGRFDTEVSWMQVPMPIRRPPWRLRILEEASPQQQTLMAQVDPLRNYWFTSTGSP